MMRAQIQMQALVYIMALVVTALVLFQGFKAIKSFSETGCRAELIRFQNQLASELKKAEANYGSVYNLDLPMPCKYNEVIFVDLNFPPETLGSSLNKPLIIDAWAKKAGNVFMVPMADQKIDVGANFTVDGEDADSDQDLPGGVFFQQNSGYVEIRPINGFAKIRIEGKAGYAMISAQ
jgi:hypothetical protein